MKERRFIQPVAMKVTSRIQFEDLGQALLSFGYRRQDTPTGGYPWIAITDYGYDEKPTLAYLSSSRKDFSEFILVEDYIPDLFLSLAAMSEGDEFYPSEWVICLRVGASQFHENKLYKCERVEEDRLYATGEYGEMEWMFTDDGMGNKNFRKATAAELIEHFTGKSEQNQDKVEPETKIEWKEMISKINNEADDAKFTAAPVNYNGVPHSEYWDTIKTPAHLWGPIEFKTEPQEYSPKFGDKVEVFIKDGVGRVITAHYLEPSKRETSGHYVKDITTGNIHFVEKVVALRKVQVEMSRALEYIAMYMKLDKYQIEIVP